MIKMEGGGWGLTEVQLQESDRRERMVEKGREGEGKEGRGLV
jgi:hypothetical protein